MPWQATQIGVDLVAGWLTDSNITIGCSPDPRVSMWLLMVPQATDINTDPTVVASWTQTWSPAAAYNLEIFNVLTKHDLS